MLAETDRRSALSRGGATIRAVEGPCVNRSVVDVEGVDVPVFDEGRVSLRCDVPRQRFLFESGHGPKALYDRRQHSVALSAGSCDQESAAVRHFWQAAVLPRLWSEEDRLVLHAAVVGMDDSRLLLVGPSGRGKSTLATALSCSGWTIWGDDVCACAEDAALTAVVRGLRLLPDAYDTLLADHPAEVIGPGELKLMLDGSPADVDVADPLGPISAILVLGEAETKVSLRALAPGAACMALVENSFCLDPTDRLAAGRRLTYAAAIAAQVPVLSLHYPRRYDAIPHVDGVIRSIFDERDNGKRAG